MNEALDSTRHPGTDLVQVAFPARRPGPGSGEAGRLLQGVALVTLSRPRALNALSFALLTELGRVVEALDADPDVRAIVITGAGTRAFAAGADIGELAEQTPASLAASEGLRGWDRVAAVAAPTIAAVRGYALGGGCELAMACDMIVAGSDAVFGQPEIKLGIIPGGGGTQRLTRAIGTARAMEIVLTGRTVRAEEAAASVSSRRSCRPRRLSRPRWTSRRRSRRCPPVRSVPPRPPSGRSRRCPWPTASCASGRSSWSASGRRNRPRGCGRFSRSDRHAGRASRLPTFRTPDRRRRIGAPDLPAAFRAGDQAEP